MKNWNWKKIGTAAAALLCVATLVLYFGYSRAHAQALAAGATTVQQAQPLRSCDTTFSQTGAANTAVTITATPPPNQSFYICSVYIAIVANAAVTGAAGPAPIFTTTGLQTNLVWWGDNSSLTIGQLKVVTDVTYPWFLKAGNPFTIVTSGGQSTESVRINVTGFYAP
jgi:hypothetical protein